jgi:putative peptidoglycan lipid II flippase
VAYALGLVGFILVKVLSPGYFARQDTRTPVRIGVQAVLLNMALNVVLVVTLVRTEFYAPHAGLAAATTISALFNALWLFRGLRGAGVYRAGPGWRRLAFQVAGASGAMAVLVLWLRGRIGDWMALGVLERVGALAVCVLAGVAMYGASCYLMGLRLDSLRQRPGTDR